jgi:predicted nucleic acid-binding protein
MNGTKAEATAIHLLIPLITEDKDFEKVEELILYFYQPHLK